MSMTGQEVTTFLTSTNVAVISTVDQDNKPKSAPIWYQWEEGMAYLFTGRNTLKWRNILENPNVSLCIDWREPPYRSVIVNGTAQEVTRSMYDLVLSMAQRYYGSKEGQSFAEDYRDNPRDIVIFRIVPTHIVSFASD